nr:nonstructural protein NS2 [Hepacivirus P]
TLQDCCLASLSLVLTLIWLGYASSYLPFLALTHSYIRTRVECWMNEWSRRESLFVLCLLFPSAVRVSLAVFWSIYLTCLAISALLLTLCCPNTKFGMYKILTTTSRIGKQILAMCRPILVWACAEKGIFWYEHLDGKLDLNWEYRDPYFPVKTQVIEAEDVGRKLACGDALKGHPVFCRAGTTVRAGIAQLAKGWKRT